MLAVASLVGVAGLVLGLAGPVEAATKTTKKVTKAAKASKTVSKPKAASSSAAASAKSVYPDATVVDLSTGKDVSLVTLRAEAKPTLIFVWAPS
jgi:hypothetical protein